MFIGLPNAEYTTFNDLKSTCSRLLWGHRDRWWHHVLIRAIREKRVATRTQLQKSPPRKLIMWYF